MPYIPPEQVAKAREIDLLTYLQTCEPEELVRFSGNTYCTRSHDSLKISNGKWFWHAQGFGGRSALDYLIKVRQMPFTEAVGTLLRQSPAPPQSAKPPPPKRLQLPQASPSPERVVRYLTGRGLDREVIRFCLDTGRLYESLPYHTKTRSKRCFDRPLLRSGRKPEWLSGFRSVTITKALEKRFGGHKMSAPIRIIFMILIG